MMNADTKQGWENKAGRARVVLGLFVLIAVVVCVVLFMLLRKPPQRAAAEVAVSRNSADTPAVPQVICGRGTVAPKVRIQIMPEVSGRAVYVHAQLHAGGVIRANERILQIDPGRYELAVRRARAVVDEAQARVDLAKAAKDMQRQYGPASHSEGQADLPLFLREPQVRLAEATLESAKAELARAELELSRTSITLPFEVLIVGPTVSLGQYVTAGQPLAVACGMDAFEVEAPIADADLARLDVLGGVQLPGRDATAPPVVAEVKAVFAGAEHTWPGRVVRTSGQVDQASGMISVVVEVPRPLDASADRPPLLPGTAVEVRIPGAPEAGDPENTENVGDF